MKKRVLDWIGINRTIVVQCIVVFSLSLVVASLVVRLRAKVPVSSEGFDFSARKNGNSSGPKIGETVDMKVLKGQDGRSLAEVAKDSTFCMIAVVDPHCEACKAAESQMSGIHNRLGSSGIPYFIVMLSDRKSAAQYFAYADSVGFGSRAFIWRTDEVQPPSSLVDMVIPSHLLLNSDGVVLDKWPGTHQNPLVRQRMINQIVLDAVEHLRGSNGQEATFTKGVQ